MSGRRTVFLAIALAVLALYFAAFEGFSRSPEPLPSEVGDKMLVCAAGGPSVISITSPRGTVSARREGVEWQSEAGSFAPIAFEGLAEALCRLPIVDRITEPKLEDFGLANPTAEIRLAMGGRERRLLAGDATPAGTLMYVKFTDEPDVLKVGVELRSQLERVAPFSR